MNDKTIIFISHSSADKKIALRIKSMLNRALELIVERDETPQNEFSIFVSSAANAIPAGEKWQDLIIQTLDQTNVFIPVISETSLQSRWVWFEIGYFWSRFNGKRIFPLTVDVDIPSPLDGIQGKQYSDEEEFQEWAVTILVNLFDF